MKKIVLLSIALLLTASMHGQSEEKEKYLNNNYSVLDMNDNDNFSSFGMIDSVLPRYRLFFTGEQHYTEGDFEVKWKMLKYLYSHAGIRALIIEHPCSYGYLLDHYMERKDSVKFNEMVDYAPEGTKERIFYRSLYEFNKNKPRNEQVRIIGIDIDFVKYYSQRAFTELLGSRTSKDNYVKMKWQTDQLINKKLSADSVIVLIQKDEALYKEFFQEDYPIFLRTVKSISCNCLPPGERKMDDPRWAKREEYMFNNYLSVLAEHPDMNMYAQFGAKHINLDPGTAWYNCVNWSSMASRLNTYPGSPVLGKVCSILLSYSYEWNEPKNTKKIFCKQAGDNSFALFKLNNTGTPFNEFSRKVQFLINLNYGTEEELAYNQSNDVYNLMEDEQYTLTGITAAYQYWDNGVVAIGYEARARDMKEKKYVGGGGFNFEFNTKQRMNGYVVNFLFGGMIQGGFSLVYNTNYKRSAFFFRPEIGIAKNFFSLSYVYNMKVYNKFLNEGINRNMLSAKIFLPFSKD